jgi:hypothetical protein
MGKANPALLIVTEDRWACPLHPKLQPYADQGHKILGISVWASTKPMERPDVILTENATRFSDADFKDYLPAVFAWARVVWRARRSASKQP